MTAPHGTRYPSPLRYPGGKARLAPVLRRVLDDNALADARYVEPYAGGAGAAMSLLLAAQVKRVHINDLDRALYAFWYAVCDAPKRFCERIAETPISIDQWHKQRAIHEQKASAPLMDLGFSTFFLNRTNRSGIIGSGRPIGGMTQGGEWRLDARFNKDDLIRRIMAIGQKASRINVTNLDAVRLLASKKRTWSRSPTLVYLDPPYYVKGSSRLYTDFYVRAQHEALAQVLGAAIFPWVTSYDDNPAIRKMYRGFQRRTTTLDYSASARSSGKEVLHFSEGLVVPTARTIAALMRKKREQ